MFVLVRFSNDLMDELVTDGFVGGLLIGNWGLGAQVNFVFKE